MSSLIKTLNRSSKKFKNIENLPHRKFPRKPKEKSFKSIKFQH